NKKMKWIYNLPYDRLTEEVTASGLKKFAAHQVFQWLYEKNEQDIDQWTNISKANRELLSQSYNTCLNTVLAETKDDQGTKKLLVELPDGQKVEAVLMKEKGHYTFCLSTQVGCALGCEFCATGKMGFKRNLEQGEILSQLLLLKKYIPSYRGKINLVFMGMGEPLLNYKNLKQALEVITSEKAIAISPKNITVSTTGILEKLRCLEQDFPKVKVSFSLNASTSAQRTRLMPISRTQTLEKALDYFRATPRKHRVTFEYVLLKGINDSPDDARQVAALVRGIPCKINLIPYNENKGIPFDTPGNQRVETFSDYLHNKGYTVTVRWSKGRGIKSGCGQLAIEY
ncbi:MAG: 23S rRNA (adenine(2503)-C(2))-methyltransferase RlmN, partial [bacterium]|nr:23S rRNA (adenine(2503)-C(2))-methyltransferase RlmN [bacterium]